MLSKGSIVGALLIVALAWGSFTLAARRVLRDAPVSTAESALSARMEAEITAGVNQIRIQQGLPALIIVPALSDVARGHSERMGREGFRGHFDPQGRGAAERLTAAGIPFVGVGENVARDTRHDIAAATEMLNGWMNSPEHRDNILDPRFTQTGVGVYWSGDRYCFTQLFVRPPDTK